MLSTSFSTSVTPHESLDIARRHQCLIEIVDGETGNAITEYPEHLLAKLPENSRLDAVLDSSRGTLRIRATSSYPPLEIPSTPVETHVELQDRYRVIRCQLPATFPEEYFAELYDRGLAQARERKLEKIEAASVFGREAWLLSERMLYGHIGRDSGPIREQIIFNIIDEHIIRPGRELGIPLFETMPSSRLLALLPVLNYHGVPKSFFELSVAAAELSPVTAAYFTAAQCAHLHWGSQDLTDVALLPILWNGFIPQLKELFRQVLSLRGTGASIARERALPLFRSALTTAGTLYLHGALESDFGVFQRDEPPLIRQGNLVGYIPPELTQERIARQLDKMGEELLEFLPTGRLIYPWINFSQLWGRLARRLGTFGDDDIEHASRWNGAITNSRFSVTANDLWLGSEKRSVVVHVDERYRSRIPNRFKSLYSPSLSEIEHEDAFLSHLAHFHCGGAKARARTVLPSPNETALYNILRSILAYPRLDLLHRACQTTQEWLSPIRVTITDEVANSRQILRGLAAHTVWRELEERLNNFSDIPDHALTSNDPMFAPPFPVKRETLQSVPRLIGECLATSLLEMGKHQYRGLARGICTVDDAENYRRHQPNLALPPIICYLEGRRISEEALAQLATIETNRRPLVTEVLEPSGDGTVAVLFELS